MRALHTQQPLLSSVAYRAKYYFIALIILVGTFYILYSAIPTHADSPGHSWQQSSLMADSSRNWVATASSSDGQKLAALDRYGYAYTSQDGGTTWAIRTSIGANDNWTSIASSADGMTLAATARNGGSIYTSADAGVTWIERTSAGSRNWWTVSIAQNGATMLAVDNGGYVYLSTDSGATWAAQTAAGTGTWASGEISENGQKIVVAIRGGLLKTSVNGGSTWTSHTGVGSRVWVDVDTSQDGTRMFASAYSGSLWRSIDSGATWVAQTAAGTKTWESVSMSADGMQIIAVINSTEAPKISRDGGTTWNFVFSNKNWADVATSGDGNTILMPGFGGLEGYIWITKDAGLTWSVAPTRGTADWRSISASNNGAVRVAAPETGHLYVSRDNGSTWNEQTSLGRKPWRASATSSDGTKIAVAAGWGGAIYTSSDSGVTWTEQTTAGLHDWYGITISNDGQKIAAISYYDDLYTSTDGGTTWTAHTELGAGLGWSSITASTDGTKLAATVEWNSLIYTSSDSGVTWTAQSGSGVQDWYGIDMSSDGTKLITTTGWGGAIYTSSDSGVTWTEQTTAGLHDWTSVALSQDGTKLVGVTYDDSIYISTDSGANWLPQTTPGAQAWTTVTMIDDGQIVTGGEATFVYATAAPAASAPSEPQTVTVDTTIDNEATVNWSAPADDGGAAITDYILEYKPSASSSWTTINVTPPIVSHTINSLPAGQHDVRLSATNSAGTSPATTPVSFTVTDPPAPETTPSAPQNVTAEVNAPNKIKVKWNAPASDGGDPVTNYKVEHKKSSEGASSWVPDVLSGTAREHIINNVQAGCYDVRISAANGQGYGIPTFVGCITVIDPATAQSSPEPAPAPSTSSSASDAAVDDNSVTIPAVEEESSVTILPIDNLSSPGSILINWKSPTNATIPPSGYVIDYRDSSVPANDTTTPWQEIANVDADKRSATITLPPGEYNVRVAALIPGEVPTRVILGTAKVTIASNVIEGDASGIAATTDNILRNWIIGCAGSVMVASMFIILIAWKRRRKKAQSTTVKLPPRRL